MNMMNDITDKQQRQQALDVRKSFIVQAPAGSGKTSLLIQRFLALLAHVQTPEEILAITFTRKAAAEMRQRISQALEVAQQPAPKDPYKLLVWNLAQKVLQRDHKLEWNLLQNLNRLRVYTIDGLCNSIVRQMPVVSGFGTVNNLVEGVDATTCYQTAIADLINSLAENTEYTTSIKNVLLHLDNDYAKIEKLLITMLSRRDQWLPHIARNNINAGLTAIINENITNCESALPSHLTKELFSILQNAITGIDTLEKLPLWQSIAESLLTKNGQWRKAFAKDIKTQMLNLVDQLKKHEDFKECLQVVQLCPPPLYNTKQQAIIDDLITTLKVLTGHLNLVFQEQQVTDYIQITLAALTALGEETNPTDLALKLDYKIKHILVDEFQDTSVTQYRLIEKLTTGWQPDDGRTLFLVGDPMQSIYKFREAKVGLFIKAKNQGINDIKLQSLTLSTNFRSEKYLIDWINTTFPHVLPQTENIATGAIKFIPATAVHDNIQQQVQMHALPPQDYLGEAQEITKIIQATRTTDPEATIAILVRSRSHLKYILPVLQTAKISYQAVELETLNKNMAIQDIFALTRALLNSADRIAWLAILRAPWCGLTLADLHALANQDPDALIWGLMQTVQLSTDGTQRLQSIKPILTTALNQVGRKSLRKLIEDTWISLHGPNLTCRDANGDARCCVSTGNILTYFELLETTQDLNLLEQKLETLYATPENTDSKLQIMTIHKAKGLEFDTVIIPGLNRAPRPQEKQLLLWNERPGTDKTPSTLIWGPINAATEDHDPVYRYLQYEDKQKNYYETGRLLYVATTRAKKSLHLLANVGDKPAPKSLLQQLWHSFKPTEIHPIEPIETVKEKNRTLKRIKAQAVTTPSIKIAQQPSFDSLRSLRTLRASADRNIGIIVHKCLEQLANNIEPISRDPQLLKQQLKQLSTLNNLDQHVKTIITAITNTLKDPKGQWILNTKHEIAHTEYSIATNTNKHYIIDRTFVADSICWIIDYKTATPKSGQNNADFMQQEFLLYKAQLDNYAEIMQHLTDHQIRKGLYFPLCCGWYEWA